MKRVVSLLSVVITLLSAALLYRKFLEKRTVMQGRNLVKHFEDLNTRNIELVGYATQPHIKALHRRLNKIACGTGSQQQDAAEVLTDLHTHVPQLDFPGTVQVAA